jgi:LmbE family N-acetylglucosaminyl deacetylase
MPQNTLASFGPLEPQQRRILVISPHCDDETLGVGGLIAEARQKEIPVTVAFLTNGDAFPLACAMSLKKATLTPADYIAFGELRQRESINALGKLGVAEGFVRFLGYPDAGLKALWETNWTPEKLYKARYTSCDHAPFPRCFTPNAPYCGLSIVDDLEHLIAISHPTDIYVTHPADDHADHAMAPLFTQAALRRLQQNKQRAWAQNTKLHYYLVHRGDWPLPQGLHPEATLMPPSGLTQADTHWQTLVLSPEAKSAKAAAINAYPSQTEVIGRLMQSFLRTNELIATPAEPEIAGDGTLATVRDAPGDDVVRFANPAADLTALSARQAGESLTIRLTTRGAVSPSVRYAIRLRAENGSYLTRTLKAPALSSRVSLETTVALSDLGLDSEKYRADRCLWIAAETGVTSRYLVDQTGYRSFHLNREALSAEEQR